MARGKFCRNISIRKPRDDKLYEGIKTAEYTPLVIKQVLTGHGRAQKNEVRLMVEKFIELNKNTKLDDTVDSIAIGICHARNLGF